MRIEATPHIANAVYCPHHQMPDGSAGSYTVQAAVHNAPHVHLPHVRPKVPAHVRRLHDEHLRRHETHDLRDGTSSVRLKPRITSIRIETARHPGMNHMAHISVAWVGKDGVPRYGIGYSEQIDDTSHRAHDRHLSRVVKTIDYSISDH